MHNGLIDLFFSRELKIEKQNFMFDLYKNNNIEVVELPERDPYEYLKTKQEHISWKTSKIKYWDISLTEKYSKKTDAKSIEMEVSKDKSIDDFVKIITLQINHNKITKSDFIDFHIKINIKNTKRLTKKVEIGAKSIWDGTRNLPYRINQIVKCMATYFFIEINSYKKNKPINVFNDENVYLVMEGINFNTCRTYSSKTKIENSLRADIIDVISDDLPNSINSKILLFGYLPRIIFDFKKLTTLFIEDLIPYQMYFQANSKSKTVFFSPVQINVLGYA